MSKLWSLLCFGNSRFNAKVLAFFWNLWLPFLGAGIRIIEINPDFSMIRVKLVHRFWNINYLGIQYGGSIYSMCDPFYMVMLQRILGKNFFVIDKAAKVEFLMPGKGELFAKFDIPNSVVNEIKNRLNEEEKIDWEISLFVEDKDGNKIARVEKQLNIRTRLRLNRLRMS